ncbi:MAG: D-2-hydroxyacid dehydrogenase [Dehalococcoidia bacterium]|nr:D-2-hydroxyacid dehydrogenase [Dehalococcoidia bacterium]
MTGFLCSPRVLELGGDEIRAAAAAGGIEIEPILLPEDPAARLTPDVLEKVEFSFYSGDLYPDFGRSFFAAAQGSPHIRWLHVMNAGIDNPVFGRFLSRGVKLTTSSGSTAMPIAQTVIGAVLMLARPFLAWGESQRRAEWRPIREANPPDLGTQTMVVFGLGAIGKEIVRLGQALGLHVIGVRRSPRTTEDTVDELVTPAELAEVLPWADWLVLSCPLTEETRNIISGEAIALLPKGARVLNIARGEVIDQAAMIEALRSGHLGGAYLDVVTPEPLPSESPLWGMENVIISPHNSAVSAGNERRQLAIFCENLRRWGRGEPMLNEVS